jgi:hypothetical protein
MKYRLVVLALLLAAGAIAVSSCGDYQVAAPATAVGTDAAPNGLLACSSLPAISQTKTIGAEGGTINIGPHKLTIPPNALNATVAITATIMSENVARVRLEPHGLAFRVPAELTLSYRHCGMQSNATARVAYVTPALDVLELMPTVPDAANRTATTYLSHFSDYALLWFLLTDHVVYWGGGTSR